VAVVPTTASGSTAQTRSHKPVNIVVIIGSLLGSIGGVALCGTAVCHYKRRRGAKTAAGPHDDAQFRHTYTDLPRSRSTIREKFARSRARSMRDEQDAISPENSRLGYYTLYSSRHCSVGFE
jgi:hypothetical protein